MADIEQSLQEIQQERSRLLTAKENLKTAITGKGVNVADDVKLDQYYTLVNSIQVGVEGGIDVSATTATEADVLSSAKFYKADGTFVSGTIQTVTASMSEGKVTVPVGYIGQEQTFEVAGGADLSFITAGVNQILSGYIGSDKDGNEVQGTIVTRTENDITANGTVVVAEGYYPTQISKTLTASTASVSGNVVEITTGWNDYKKVTVGTALPGGMNITPSATADYVLHKDSFITNGNITLAKEPNYLEENIREGVTMWGKTGTYKGEGGGGGDSGNTQFTTVKVTEYSPYVPAYPAQIGYNVTEITDPNNGDYSAYLGLYTVTEDTKSCTKFGRIFKSTNGKFLRAINVMQGTQASDDSDSTTIQWRFCDSDSASDRGTLAGTPGTSGLPDSVTKWQNMTSYSTVTLNLTSVETSSATPEIPMVLKAAEVDSYDDSTITWATKDSVRAYSEYEQEPIEGGVYTLYNDKFIGHWISIDRDLASLTTFYAPFSAPVNIDMHKHALTYSTNTSWEFVEKDGVQCLNGGYVWAPFEYKWKNPLSISFWFNWTAALDYTNMLWFGYRSGNNNYGLRVYGKGDGHLRTEFTYAGGEVFKTDIIPELNVWHNLVVISNGDGTIDWYLDGEYKVSIYYASLLSVHDVEFMGFTDYAKTQGYLANLYQCDLRVFPLALTTADIRKMYLNGPNPKQGSDNKNGLVFEKIFMNDSMVTDTGDTLTLSYGTKNVTNLDGIPCWQFDGSTRVDFDAKNLPTVKKARTISVFFKPSSTDEQIVFSYGNTVENEMVALAVSDSKISIYGYNNVIFSKFIPTQSEWTTGWHNVVITFEDNRWTIYTDMTKPSSAYYIYLNTGATLGSIGGAADPEKLGAMPFIGYIAGVRVWDRVLTPFELVGESYFWHGLYGGSDEQGTITYNGVEFNSGGTWIPAEPSDVVSSKTGMGGSYKVSNYRLSATASNGAICTFAPTGKVASGITFNSDGTFSGDYNGSAGDSIVVTRTISAEGCEDKTITFTLVVASCVHPDSLVLMADGSEKKIRDIQVGESVMSINQETGEFEPDTVIRNEYDGQRTFPVQDRWIFSDGTELITIARHRIYNVDRGAYVYMDAWKIGDVARKYDGQRTVLIGHEVINEPEVMATIRLKNNTYIVNGLLTGTRDAVPVTPFDKTGA